MRSAQAGRRPLHQGLAVRIYTGHVRPRSPPVLVREGFSWGAFLFGGLWLLCQRVWIMGLLALAGGVLIGALTTDPARIILELGLAILLGLTGRDLKRWSLAWRGYTLVHVIAANSDDAALARLLSARPDLGACFMPAEAAL